MLRFEDGSDALGQNVTGHQARIAIEEAGVVGTGVVGEGFEPGSRSERRGRFVEADVAVAADPQQLQIDSSGLGDQRFVPLRRSGQIRAAAVRPVQRIQRQVDLADCDVVLLRQDPPFDMNYITATHMLEQIHPGTLVVNNPAEVRNAPEKIFILDFPQFMPPTLITKDPEEIKAFRKEHGDIILKPLYGNGGAGVFRLPEQDQNLNSLLEMFDSAFREAFIAQQYLPDVRKGDKRIILVDGVPVGAINRVPQGVDHRGNIHVGAIVEKSELTARDREICDVIGPYLAQERQIFVGIDVIGDFLTEVNVTSPTGIRELSNFAGQRQSDNVIAWMETASAALAKNTPS